MQGRGWVWSGWEGPRDSHLGEGAYGAQELPSLLPPGQKPGPPTGCTRAPGPLLRSCPAPPPPAAVEASHRHLGPSSGRQGSPSPACASASTGDLCVML